MHRVRIRRRCPLPSPSLSTTHPSMLMFMLWRRQRHGVRVLRPPDARREGVRISRCHGVQVEADDVAEAGVCSSMSAPAGYSEDMDTDTASGSYCCWCVCDCSSCTLWKLLRAGTPATSRSEKAGYCRKGRTSVCRRRASLYTGGSSLLLTYSSS
jgi:hypothetical protein